MTSKNYEIIYADPPWSYYNDTDADPDCTTIKGVRRPPYSVMGSKSIMRLNVRELSADNCVLFIWTTDYHLGKCLKVIEAWGFVYKTVGFAWQKLNKKDKPICFTGAWTLKSGIELCLLATKGKDAHKFVKKHNVRALICSRREIHSKKPDEVRDRIEELIGERSRIELFARQKRKGWDVWGDEVESDTKLTIM
jgi:N6-adenosine-specific RNA methylase IME4